MKPIREMDTVQIEITNACVRSCSNCTRFCGHHRKPFFMDFETFRAAVDSLADFPQMVGIMGGEPLLHPQFEQFCAYLREKIPPLRCGLWSAFPKGQEQYAPVIAETFGAVLLNDHSTEHLFHRPLLVAYEDVKEKLSEADFWYATNYCYFQNSWSAAVTPKGAYFCEVAAALDILLDYNLGWPVGPKWWKKTPPLDFAEQAAAFCKVCGGGLALTARLDTDGKDDVSPWWDRKLAEVGSPKAQQGRCVPFAGKIMDPGQPINNFRADLGYAIRIAGRYGLDLTLNPGPNLPKNYRAAGYLRPRLKKEKRA